MKSEFTNECSASRGKSATTEGRQDRMNSQLQENIQNFWSEDSIKSIEDVYQKLEAQPGYIPIGFTWILQSEKLLILSIVWNDGVPRIVGSITLCSSLSISITVNGGIVAPQKFKHITSKEKLENFYTLRNLMAAVKNWIVISETDCSELLDKAKDSLEKYMDKCEGIEKQKQCGFLREQIGLLESSKKSRRYSPDCLISSYLLYAASPNAYEEFRKQNLLCLPSSRTLRSLTSIIKANESKYLKSRFSNLNSYERHVILMIDEIYTASRVEYSSSEGKIIGLTTDNNVAGTILTFMISSIAGQYRDVVSFYPINGINAKKLHVSYLEVLKYLDEIGFNVTVLCVDNHPVNRAFLTNILCSGSLKSQIKNPVNDKPLFLLFDPVHNIKNVYNNFQGKRIFKLPSFHLDNLNFVTTAKFDDLCELHNLEATKPIKLGYKLTEKCLNPTSIEKSSVKLSMSVFNESTENALRFYSDHENKDWIGTATFISHFLYNNFQGKRIFKLPSFHLDNLNFVTTAKFDDLCELHNLEATKPIKLGYKLTEKCLNPTSIEKSSVKLSMSVFNESTENALRFYSDHENKDWIGTATFISHFLKLWSHGFGKNKNKFSITAHHFEQTALIFIEIPASLRCFETLKAANTYGLSLLSAAHVVLSQLEEIQSVVKAVYQKPETDMGDYWLSFLEMTDPLAQNVHACHTQQYYEYVSSSYEMFPGLMAYNNHEYGRHLPDFWAMLNNLSEDQSRYFSLHFAQSQTGLPYSCQPMDLWIEVTMNLGSKLKAGWLQLLQDDKQLFSTIRNANAVGRIRQALETQLNSIRKQSKHTDCQPARLRKDEKAVQDILTSLDAFECDLFGEDDPALRSIQSGIKTTESVALDLSVALPDGKAQADILLDQRVFSKDFKLSDRVPKNKRLTFDNNKVAKSGNKAISQAQMESAGLAAIIELAEGTGALTLEEIMENRVTEECLSIFNVDGSLRHTAKSKLFEHLNLQPTADKPAIYSSLIDMSMLFHLATPADREKKKQDGSDYKWQDYIDKICFMVHSRHPDAEQTYAINDPYPKPNEYSIKDDERDRRAASHPNAGNKFPTRDEKFPGPKEFSSFMSNSQNKVRLQNLVRQCLTSRVERNRTIWVNKGETTNLGTGEDHPDLIFNHTEADTMIFGIYAKLRAVYTQPIIIDSEDTDVYIQAAYVAKRTTGKMYIKLKKHLIDCTTLVDNEVADSIIAAHVISGSDHSSGFYHKGKASIIKCVITDAEARELLSGLGQELELSESVEAAAKYFFLSKIYHSEEESCAAARAVKTHPCPFGNGWALINGKCRPVRHSRPVLHSQENTDSDDSDSTGDTDSDTEEDTEYDGSSESDLSEED
ncbi:hypothetical protein GQR58_024759 [Nymphon striatum]|nr:hypothetical protein GQR58_024759 [Nymphon striatum]